MRAPFDGPHVQGNLYVAHGEARRFLFTHWPLLSLGEPEAAFEHRCSGRWPVPAHGVASSWAALDARVNQPRLLERLMRALPPGLKNAEDGTPLSWAKVLRHTGLRSVRVHWAESRQAQRAILMEILPEAQALLADPLGWRGPVLGLAGASGLELVGGGTPGSGQVRLDPFATGQTLVVDDWGVMAHEWLHTLDATLARDCLQPTRWMTLGLGEEVPFLPEHPALNQGGSAWWDLVNRIQFSPLPEPALSAVTAELAHWPTRWRETLGPMPGLDAQLAQEAVLLNQGVWREAPSQNRWQVWLSQALPDADEALIWRMAQLFSAEMALIGHTEHLDGPIWATFLRHHAHDRGLQAHAARATRQQYLASPIELMARSFEAAFGPHDGGPNPVWRVTRSTAGMVWPLPAESAYQREGWNQCLEALRPWWALRQKARSAIWRSITPRGRRDPSLRQSGVPSDAPLAMPGGSKIE
jgi:hypothetical protein